MFRQQMRGSYTRKEYMGGIPGSRISQFDTGNLNTKFPVAIHLVATEPCLIRDQALEAARISGNRHIAKLAGNAYMFKVRLYPHQVLREHKIAVGAGADRISSGMRAAFGSPVGTAARVEPGMKVLTIWTTQANVEHAKEAMRKSGSKLPTPWRLVIEIAKKK
jgi:large subunit ribosomal protein L10e